MSIGELIHNICLVANDTVGIAVFNLRTSALLNVNQYFLKLIDGCYSDVKSSIGKAVDKIVPNWQGSYMQLNWDSAINTGKICCLKKYSHKGLKCETLYLDVRITPLYLENSYEYIIISVEDVTKDVMSTQILQDRINDCIKKEKIRSVISKERPDIIIVTGDCIEKAEDAQGFLEFISFIKKDFLTCLCFGNHDYKAFQNNNNGLQDFKKALKNIGIHVLQDECFQYQKNNCIYNIIGFKDISVGNPNLKSAFENCNNNAVATIGFSHNPDIIFRMPRECVNYLLCGHFHGGQIWTPFNLEFKILRNEKLSRMGIKRGLHKLRGIQLYINRGLGNVVIPLRFFSRPEITLFYFP
jgi:predicted MPP superfamily phosphohydrolase